MPHPLAGLGHALRTASLELRHPRLWFPAAVLLLPTLALQLALPDWLRSRLSPSIGTVIAGSLLIVLLTQIAAAASWGWVHARRRRQPVRGAVLIREAVRLAALTTLGMLAGVLPGLWLQARYASRMLQDVESRSATTPRPRHWTLLALAALTLVVSVLGQSLAAGLAEALGTITPQGTVDGRLRFRLAYGPHVLTSLVAYAWTVLALTLQAIGVSTLHGQAASALSSHATDAPPRSSPLPLRAAVISAAVLLIAGAIAAVYKVQQHLH